MAISSGTDYVFAPHVDVIMEKACVIGTTNNLYLVPDRKHIDKGWVHAALSSTYTVESISFDGMTPREMLAALLVHDDTTLASLHEFMEHLKTQLDVVRIIDLSTLKKLKVKAGLFGGSIVFKPEGKMGYDAFVTAIPKPHKKPFAAFFGPIAEKINT